VTGRAVRVCLLEVREGHSLTKLLSLGAVDQKQQPFRGRDRVVVAGFCLVFGVTARTPSRAFRCLHDSLDPTDEPISAA